MQSILDDAKHLADMAKWCNTSYPPGQFTVISKKQTGGWYAQRSQRRIESKAQASST